MQRERIEAGTPFIPPKPGIEFVKLALLSEIADMSTLTSMVRLSGSAKLEKADAAMVGVATACVSVFLAAFLSRVVASGSCC